MADMSEDIVSLMDRISLGQSIHKQKAIEKGKHHQVALDDGTKNVLQLTHETAAQADLVQSLNTASNIPLSRHVAALKHLTKKSAEIAEAGQALQNATAEYIMTRFLSSGSVSHNVQKLLSHFESELKAIIEHVFETTDTNQNVLLKILEECYVQSYNSSGDLHIDNYFLPLYESALGSPYDPDFESEEYYDHENRLQVDPPYAEADRIRQQRESEKRYENEKMTRRAWVDFWVQLLNRCLGGPTLFWPLADSSYEDLPAPPRYLFRTFDASSSGRSDHYNVTSSASKYGPEASRIDLLSLKPKEGCDALCTHLSKDCFGDANHADNLMSWSSSLLFVIQYAIWRCQKGRRSPADVNICVVDTAKFPHGQFARDLWLLEKCRDETSENPRIRNLIHLREIGYDNGEYLSQGTLIHTGRSCVVTLEDLIRLGLYNLYPELNDPGHRDQWTKRVRDLRSLWATPSSTTREEIRLAFDIATSCFCSFGAFDITIALYLLMFKTRSFRGKPTKSEFQ